jgi:hypothetical protein
MDWPEVAARLAGSRNYWLGTTLPSGAPHAAPVWGVVAGQTLGHALPQPDRGAVAEQRRDRGKHGHPGDRHGNNQQPS